MREPLKGNAALLVVDVQNYFFEKEYEGFLSGAKKIVPRINKAILDFKERNLPVIFTRHAHDKNKPTGQMGKWWCEKLPWLDSIGSELSPLLAMSKNDTVLLKNKYSAFEGTGLNELLKEKNIKTIYLCGVMTHVCVETTARHAFLLEYQPVVLADACADLSEHHHKGALLNLGHAFALIKNAKDLKAML